MALLDFIQACLRNNQAAMHATLPDLDVHQTDEDDQTALLWASRVGHSTSVASLIALGNKIDHAVRYGRTPLTFSVSNGNQEIVSQLLVAGAEVNHVGLRARPPLIYAAESGI